MPMTCPVYTVNAGAPASWGTAIVLTAPSGGFGIVTGTVDLVCGDGSHHALPVLAWTDGAITVTLPATPPSAGPYHLAVNTTLGPRDCEQPLNIASTVPPGTLPPVVTAISPMMPIVAEAPVAIYGANFGSTAGRVYMTSALSTSRIGVRLRAGGWSDGRIDAYIPSVTELQPLAGPGALVAAMEFVVETASGTDSVASQPVLVVMPPPQIDRSSLPSGSSFGAPVQLTGDNFGMHSTGKAYWLPAPDARLQIPGLTNLGTTIPAAPLSLTSAQISDITAALANGKELALGSSSPWHDDRIAATLPALSDALELHSQGTGGVIVVLRDNVPSLQLPIDLQTSMPLALVAITFDRLNAEEWSDVSDDCRLILRAALHLDALGITAPPGVSAPVWASTNFQPESRWTDEDDKVTNIGDIGPSGIIENFQTAFLLMPAVPGVSIVLQADGYDDPSDLTAAVLTAGSRGDIDASGTRTLSIDSNFELSGSNTGSFTGDAAIKAPGDNHFRVEFTLSVLNLLDPGQVAGLPPNVLHALSSTGLNLFNALSPAQQNPLALLSALGSSDTSWLDLNTLAATRFPGAHVGL